MMGYGWKMMGDWGGFGILNLVSTALLWLLLILVIAALLRYLSGSGREKEEKPPLRLLKERYARGEINKEEFEEKKKDLLS